MRSWFAGWLISILKHFGQDDLENNLVTEAWFPSPIPLLKAYAKACLLMFACGLVQGSSLTVMFVEDGLRGVVFDGPCCHPTDARPTLEGASVDVFE